eukprot:scaffold265671_cov31-Tisochrysis_lutea.AAC.2
MFRAKLTKSVRRAFQGYKDALREILGRVNCPQCCLARPLPLAMRISARVAELERKVNRHLWRRDESGQGPSGILAGAHRLNVWDAHQIPTRGR